MTVDWLAIRFFLLMTVVWGFLRVGEFGAAFVIGLVSVLLFSCSTCRLT